MSSAADQTRETPTLEPETPEIETKRAEVVAGVGRVMVVIILPVLLIAVVAALAVTPFVVVGYCFGPKGLAVLLISIAAALLLFKLGLAAYEPVVEAYREGVREYRRRLTHKVTKTRRAP